MSVLDEILRRRRQLAAAWEIADQLGGRLWRWYWRRRFLAELARLDAAARALGARVEELADGR